MRGREGSRWLTAELSEGGKAHRLNDWLTEEVCEWGRVELREGGRREGVWEWGTALREREGWSDWAEGGSILFLRREAWGVREREAWGVREVWGREEWQTALIGVLDRVDRSEGLQLQSAEMRERPRGAAECRSNWGSWRIEEWRRNLNIVRVFVILDSRFFNGFLYGSGLGSGLGFLIKPGPDPISNRTG